MDAEAIFPYSTYPKVQVNCPICLSENVGILRTDRYGYPVHYATCGCGMEYLTEQMTREGYDALYQGAYRALVAARTGVTYAGRPHARLTGELLRTACHMVFGRSRFPRVLDAGGSNGLVGREVCSSQLTVLDPAVQELPTDGTTIIHGYLEDPIRGEFDLAICYETVDHLTRPVDALANLRAVAPRLVLNYIDVDYMRKWRKVAVKIDHPMYWTRASMMAACERAGWQAVWGLPLYTMHRGRRVPTSTLLILTHKG